MASIKSHLKVWKIVTLNTLKVLGTIILFGMVIYTIDFIGDHLMPFWGSNSIWVAIVAVMGSFFVWIVVSLICIQGREYYKEQLDIAELEEQEARHIAQSHHDPFVNDYKAGRKRSHGGRGRGHIG